MKMIRCIKLAILIFLIINKFIVLAHFGGHYSKNNLSELNTWQLSTDSFIKGNFSYGNNSFIMLEQENGRTIKILITSLKPQ